MAVQSKVNPNFPIPGLDQSSKGFRDNFATIKNEIEAIQSKTLVFAGGLQGTPPVIIDSGSTPITINAVLHPNMSVTTVTGSSIDLSAGNWFSATITAPTTLTFTNSPTGVANTFYLRLINAGTNVTWGSSVKWANATPPTLTVSGTDILNFLTFDGTTWYGHSLLLNAG